jgi:hypothetical protein
MPTLAINNESDLLPYLVRARVWALLFATEVGAVSVQEASEELHLDTNEFGWLRVVALKRARGQI